MNNMKILFISLGCDKNLVDSEHMLGLLVEHGFEITDSEEDAEVIVINTCCFIHDAKEESIQNILEMAKYRTAGSCKVLLVTGCMAERYRDEIIEEIPEVDAVLGTNSYDKILDAIQDVLGGDRFQEYADLKGLPKIDAQRVVTTGGHYEYLKIAEGCDKHCTYCIIPKLRGPYRSVPMEELIAEAKTMAEQGVKELVLVAQETTIYGIDLYGKPSLHLLLKELCKIPELYWIRILYCYPEDIYPELVQTMKEEPKVCHYLDLPIQHANDEILRRMGRRTSKQELIDKRAAQRTPRVYQRHGVRPSRRIHLLSGGGNTGCCDGASDRRGGKTGPSGRTDGAAAGYLCRTRRAQDRPGASCYDRGQSGG